MIEKMRKKIFVKMCKNFYCRERLSKRSLWISFLFAICTSDIMPLPFSLEQQRWIIFRYGACPSVKTIRREFRQKFDVPPFDVPGELAFYRIIGLTKDSIPQTQQFPSLKRKMELVDQWQDAAKRILTLSVNQSSVSSKWQSSDNSSKDSS